MAENEMQWTTFFIIYIIRFDCVPTESKELSYVQKSKDKGQKKKNHSSLEDTVGSIGKKIWGNVQNYDVQISTVLSTIYCESFLCLEIRY